MQPPTAAGVAVHVLGGGVGHDVRAPLKGTAVDRGGEGVVHNQRDAVAVGGSGKFFNIQHRQRRIGDGLAENGLGIGPEGCVQLLRVCSPGSTKVKSTPMRFMVTAKRL